jgi:protocatechuate 3,4-dioxygenase beta subunit
MKRTFYRLSLAPFLLVVFLGVAGQVWCAEKCPPTEPDMLGPFYKPDAPVRSGVGRGYLLSGTVRSAKDCASLPGVKLEFWLAGPDGEYADRYRATVFPDKTGTYRFESHFPPPYSGRPPHIHIKASAPGFKTLVTQHYPARGRTQGMFDLVLVPEQ